MPISLSLPQFTRLEVSILSAAHSALSTFILQNRQVRDLSRLGLICCTVNWERIEFTERIFAFVTLESTNDHAAGIHYSFAVQLANAHHQVFANVKFEILERKRGVKSSILKDFSSPKRIAGKVETQVWSLGDFCARFREFKVDSCLGFWPFEALILLILGDQDAKTDHYSFRYNAHGVADLRESIAVLKSAGPDALQSPIEIVQGSSLIGQLI